MINLNPFAISNLLIFISSSILIVILIIFGKNRIHKKLIFFNFSLCTWGLFALLTQIIPDIRLWNVGLCGVAFSTPTYCDFVIEFLALKLSRLRKVFYTGAIICSVISLTGNFDLELKYRFNSIYFTVPNNYNFVFFFFIWFVIGAFGFIKLAEHYRINSQLRNQIAYIFIASLIAFTSGIFIFLTALGAPLYPYSNFCVAFYGIIITYAILKHKLADINIVFRKSLIYSLLILVITLFYLLTVLMSERLLQGIVGYKSLVASIFTSLIVAIIFVPLKNHIQNLVERYFFRGTQTEIADENERLRQELARSERLKAVSTLASGMAHEIKNPLTALKTFSEFLPHKIDDKEFLIKFSKIIGGEVSRIDNLVHQLLEFSKPSPVVLKDVQIHKIIDDTLAFLSNDFIKHKIYITKKFNCNPSLTLKADPNQLKQAFLNIFVNATDAMSTGGNLEVVTGISRTHSLEITIGDTGSGISPQDLPHIFDPFFTKKEGGTGLGLAITHGIIKEHNGKIGVRSKLGEGTTFTIELPLNPA